MPTESHSFKRLVLSLQPSAPNRAVRFAVDLADLLGLDLLGLLLQDNSLRDLACIPFAREFRSLGGGWHRLDLDRLARDLDATARGLERTFTEATRSLSRRPRFSVVRGPVAEAVTSVFSTGDIVMIVEPASAAERATGQFFWLVEAALRSAAAVMLVPARISHSKGPIVALATTTDDPSIAAAAVIALAAREPLVVVEPGHGDDPHIGRLAADTGLAIQHVAAGDVSLADPAACLHLLQPIRERLVVMTRPPSDSTLASAIAAARQVPVLIVEPSGPSAKREEP